MQNLIKISISLLSAAMLFKFGFDRAAREDRGSSSVLPHNFQPSPGRLSYASHTNLLPRQSSIRINGMPAEVDLYTSAESFDEQTEKFEGNWRSQGYKTSAQALGNMKILSAMNENTRQFECAMLIPDANSKRTFVIPAQLDLRHSPQQSSSKMLAYPNAQTFLHLESNDLTGHSENLIQLSEAGVPAVINYYRSQFLQEGWQVAETPKLMYDPQYADQAVFERGQEESWVYASKMDGRNETMIFTVHNQR